MRIYSCCLVVTIMSNISMFLWPFASGITYYCNSVLCAVFPLFSKLAACDDSMMRPSHHTSALCYRIHYCWLDTNRVSYGVSHGSLRLFPPLSGDDCTSTVSARRLWYHGLRFRIVQGYFAILLVVLALLSVPLYYRSAR